MHRDAMAETNLHPNFNDKTSSSQIPWRNVLVVVVFIGMGILAFWVTREKKSGQAKTAILQSLDLELTADEKAVNAQREKVNDLTKQVEALRRQIQEGHLKDAKAAIAEFNTLATQQRAARETFVQMADQYNQKVAKYQQLEQ
jgi:anti-sigma28 factor (negative regulator of flagellin synthesis)